jgi:hypothetical protein
MSYITKQNNQLRRALESAVMDIHGEISVSRQGLIQAVCRHDAIATMLQRWLREAESPTLSDRRAILHDIGAATEARTKAIKGLGIDKTADPSDTTAAYLADMQDGQS